MNDVRIHPVSSAIRTLGTTIVAIILGAGAIGCDTQDEGHGEPREIQCNLSEPECMELPEAAEAITVVESMGIDPDEADIVLEVVVDEDVAELFSSEDELASVDEVDAVDVNVDAPPAGSHAYGDALLDPLDTALLPGGHATSCPNGPSNLCCTCVWGDGYSWGCACG